MCRLLIHVEGEAEETFVNEVLAGHLYHRGYTNVSARLLGNARQRDRRGGIGSWPSVRRDILNHLKEDRSCLSTMMVDYFRLPHTWPGRSQAVTLHFPQKATTIEDALLTDVCSELGEEVDCQRFAPYVMMHEFEGLLFSDCAAFAKGIGRPGLAPQFEAIRNAFHSPEEINDSPLTAPSKRVMALVPGYQKPVLGLLAVLEIGLDRIRSECPHFRQWLQRLESWTTRYCS